MDASAVVVPSAELPSVPTKHNEFVSYIASHPDVTIPDLTHPYRTFDSRLREVYAQVPDHEVLKDPLLNVVPVFAGHESDIKTRARDLANETTEEKERYIMSLNDEDRRPTGSPAVVGSFKEFQNNFNVFSEGSLVDMDWDNVVVAGSAAVTPLMPVPEKHRGSKRALRSYYHEILAPASDVDLFLYDLTEEAAVEKIKQIETKIRDSILQETTTVRTKNAITIASQYPTRHVQIVLRIYKSISEILTGFDVDCSCAAYDGKQVYASPRALAAYMTQINPIDLSRRSPSYENRLSKYSRRGFEVYWPILDRSRVDPTIFERNFPRTFGLARLLVLEKLPKSSDRDDYLDQRRQERGRPAINRWIRQARQLRGNIKDNFEDEVAEWVDQGEVSNYHTFTVPYGEKFHARKIDKLLYTKDLLLNAEWNQTKERDTNLHRHPAFFGNVEDVIEDCCGYCPKPVTPEDEELAEEEDKIYVSGKISFIKDDPGRQQIGSFNPLTEDDWTEMAYVGNTARLCQAIVDRDVEHVQDWLSQEGADPNRRDYTGRTPLHLATMCSSPEVVKCLVEHGAKLIARIADGRTALHIAASRGEVEMVKILMDKSEANEEVEMEMEDAKRKARKTDGASDTEDESMAGVENENEEENEGEEDDEDYSEIDEDEEDEDSHSMATGSFVKVSREKQAQEQTEVPEDEEHEPDFYDVNVLAWDAKCSPLHLAIINGHTNVVKEMVQNYGADVLLPIKLIDEYTQNARGAILTLVLGLALPKDKAVEMTELLLDLGASPAQADVNQQTALYYIVAHGAHLLDTVISKDEPGFKRAVNHVSFANDQWNPRTMSLLAAAIDNHDIIAVMKLLENGATPEVDFASWSKSVKIFVDQRTSRNSHNRFDKAYFEQNTEQPLVIAIESEQPDVAIELVKAGADPNTLTQNGARVKQPNSHARTWTRGDTVLDLAQTKLKALRDWLESADSKSSKSTKPLQEDSNYLGEFEESSYQRWVAETLLHREKDARDKKEKARRKTLADPKETKGLKLKEAAVTNLISQLEAVEKALLERGAKKFYELYPDIPVPSDRPHYSGCACCHPKVEEEFKIQFTFNDGIGSHPDEKQEGFVKLFEAAWAGDLETIKRLTLATWGKDNDQSPLKLVATDQLGHSPFQLAVLRGHLEAAFGMLQVVQIQYLPREDPQERYILHDGHTSDETDNESDGTNDESDSKSDSESDDSIHVYKTVMDDTFTIENIGEVSSQVKSRVTAVKCLNRGVGAFGEELANENRSKGDPIFYGNQGLFGFAVFTDDMKLFQWLLDIGLKFQREFPGTSDGDNPPTIFTINPEAFQVAMRLGRTKFLAEMLKQTGVGLPLEELVKKSGVEIKEKPKYYQGLSVHGKKRKDWVARGRGIVFNNNISTQNPPLLIAAKDGNIDTIEWFMSEAPLRHFKKFTEDHADDKRIKHLASLRGGIDKTLSTFLGVRSGLALHCVVMSKPKEDTPEVLQYLIDAMPSAIDSRSQEGWTPLMLAFSLHRHTLAKVLIDAGSNQTLRDKIGCNLAHHIVCPAPCILFHKPLIIRLEKDSYRGFIELIDPRLRSNMFVERASWGAGAMTPLSYLISKNLGEWYQGDQTLHDPQISQVIKTVLAFSGGDELEMINGEGNSPLHTAVLNRLPHIARTLLEFRPGLLYRENAVGRTPLEVAEDAAVIKKTANTPTLRRDAYGTLRRPIFLKQTLGMDGTQYYEAEEKKKTGDAQGSEDSKEETMLKLCRSFAEKMAADGEPVKRKLVTLYEANEVAKRLAAKSSENNKARRRTWATGDDDGDAEGEGVKEENVRDEVDEWFAWAHQDLDFGWVKKGNDEDEDDVNL